MNQPSDFEKRWPPGAGLLLAIVVGLAGWTFLLWLVLDCVA